MGGRRETLRQKQIPKNIDAESRVDSQQKRRRRQKARGFKRFNPTVVAQEMVAETAARERCDPLTPQWSKAGL